MTMSTTAINRPAPPRPVPAISAARNGPGRADAGRHSRSPAANQVNDRAASAPGPSSRCSGGRCQAYADTVHTTAPKDAPRDRRRATGPVERTAWTSSAGPRTASSSKRIIPHRWGSTAVGAHVSASGTPSAQAAAAAASIERPVSRRASGASATRSAGQANTSVQARAAPSSPRATAPCEACAA